MTETSQTPRRGASEAYWHSSMARAFGRLEGKIDQLLASHVIQKEITDDHEHRIRHLENGNWRRIGFAAAISSMGGGFVAWAVKAGVWPL